MHIPVFKVGNNAKRLSKILLFGILSFRSEIFLELNKCMPSLESFQLSWQREVGLPGEDEPLASHVSQLVTEEARK